MEFANTVFTLSTNPHSDPKNHPEAAIKTDVYLSACSVPDDIIVNSAISGQSPRVRFQGAWRKNGVPKELKISWLDWFGKPARIAQSPMTPEAIAIRAMSDPAFLQQMLDELAKKGLVETNEVVEETTENAEGN